jgi:uncharacterized protein YhhL (DUF1145 family)
MDWRTLLVLLFLPMTLTFWAIVHVAAIAPFRSTAARFIWLAVVTFLPVVGAAIYLVAGRPRAGPQTPSS